MTVSFVGAQGAAAATVTIPTHQVGDLILIFAYRDGSNTVPSTPAASGTVPAWASIGATGGNTNSSSFAHFTATATTTTSGTWTNATELICLVYRGARIGASIGGSGAATTTVNYPALNLQRTDNTSWVVGVAGHRTATNVDLAPGAMTNRAFAGTEAAGHDTNATVTTWASTNVTVNASSAYRSWVVELRDKTYDLLVDKGTYTLTGNAVTLAKGVKVTADKGTFTLTGNAATLLQTHKTIVDAGSYALTGNDATLRRTYKVTADAGAYIVTGNDAGLLQTHKTIVDAGAYTLTGNAVTLTEAGGVTNYTLVVDKGTFTLTGNAASLVRTYRNVVDAGSYAVTGQPIASSRTRVLQVDRGLYTLTGRPANLGTPVTTVTRYILIT